METTPLPKTSPVASRTAPALTPAARQAWQVTFVTPAPTAMPSERLKARAELVRSALSSGGY